MPAAAGTSPHARAAGVREALTQADKGRRPRATSLDHLVGAGDDRLRDGKSKSLRGLEIDHKLDLGRLFDWEIAGQAALKYLSSIDAGLAVEVPDTGAIADQAAGDGILAPSIDRGDRMAGCQRDMLLAAVLEEWIRNQEKRAGAAFPKPLKGRVKLALTAGRQYLNLEPKRVGGYLQFLRIARGG